MYLTCICFSLRTVSQTMRLVASVVLGDTKSGNHDDHCQQQQQEEGRQQEPPPPATTTSANFRFCFRTQAVCFTLVLVRSFPKQVYLWGSILEKKWLDTLVGALGRVGRGFGSAGRAELCWGVGFGRADRAGLGLSKIVVSVFWFNYLIDLLVLFGVYAGIIEFWNSPKGDPVLCSTGFGNCRLSLGDGTTVMTALPLFSSSSTSV